MTPENLSQENRTPDQRGRRSEPNPKKRGSAIRTHRNLAVGIVLAALAVVVLAAIGYVHWTHGAKDIVQAELAGTAAGIARVVGSSSGTYRHALRVDFAFIACYFVAISLAAFVGAQLATTRFAYRVYRGAIVAVGFAAVCDCLENGALLLVLRHDTPSGDRWAQTAAAFAFVKFVVGIPAAVVAASAVLSTVWRGWVLPLVEHGDRRRKEIEALLQKPVEGLPARDPDWAIGEHGRNDSAAVRRAAWRANSNLPESRTPGGLGFCVSGGGIRSATFALGALSTLRTELLGARYLVSVSGGGYATGAMQLALQKTRKDMENESAEGDSLSEWISLAAPADVYEPGSSELDHTRKHGKYLADGAGQWLQAIGAVLRGVLINLLIIGTVVVLTGRLLAHAYQSFPGDLLTEQHFRVQTGIGWAAAVPALAALVLWCASVLVEPQFAKTRKTFAAIALGAIGLAAAVTLFGVIIPLLAFLCSKPSPGTLTGTGVPSSTAGALLAAFVALGSNPKSRQTALSDVKKAAAWYGKASSNQRSWAARAAVLLGGLALVGGLLLMFGVVLSSTGAIGGTSTWPGHHREWQVTLAFAIVALFFLGVDQVRWSLHPFYRRRLATAFAVRRMRSGGEVRAVGYDYSELTPLAGNGPPAGEEQQPASEAKRAVQEQPVEDEQPVQERVTIEEVLLTDGLVVVETSFSVEDLDGRQPSPPQTASEADDSRSLEQDPQQSGYAAKVKGFPQVIFACSAHVSGQQLTPPGRQVLGWTMASDYLGSPLLGWAKTDPTYKCVSETLRRDLTVEAAQAISGAAIASQMGRMQRGYSKLLTLTNIRLGSWLPNPAFLDALATDPAWWRARIPRRRYLSTLAKELVGHFPDDGPLVFVTDGGHYDNLGLLELLRHRCERIVCIDASGDHGDVAATLAQAVQLAYEELGVEITLNEPHLITTADKDAATPDDLLAELGTRVKRACVVKGTISYPALGPDLPAATGDFILGKAVLTANMPFDVLAYATRDASFPNDSTADQWYDADRFDSYHALGRFVGHQVVNALPWRGAPLPGQTPPPGQEARTGVGAGPRRPRT